tara:strand:- start:1774 stop:2478 length:705 start_codon:yes stop_codon:yes gene_type:complete
MKIVSICGKKRSGKDTVGKMMASLEPSMTYSLAYPVKVALAAGFSGILTNQGYLDYEAFDGTREDIDRELILDIPLQQIIKYIGISFAFIGKNLQDELGAKVLTNIMQDLAIQYNKNNGFSIRQLMQIVGTDIGCNVLGNDTWLQYALSTWVKALDRGIYKYFIITDVRQDHEIAMFRAMGANVLHIERDDINNNDDHITEIGITPAGGEFIIKNDKSTGELYAKVKQYLDVGI